MRRALAVITALASIGCAGTPAPPVTAPVAAPAAAPVPRNGLGATRQLVLVVTATWDTTGGMLQRYERGETSEAWRAVGTPVPVVVGRTGLAWDDRFQGSPGSPVKREGDGRAPAGIFPLSTVFGFASREESGWVRAPYVPLTPGTECVDDVSSARYNSIVERGETERVDWTSSERMRQIDQYRLGVVVEYNRKPRAAGRGSCIFLHVWAGPGSSTAGCTAMAERDLRDLVLWMDRERQPVLVQLTAAEHRRLRDDWRIP